MIGVLIIPTGLGATIGGNSGDGNPVAKLLGKCCDTLITHPNVVNGADINEMPDNALYVEGSTLNRFLNRSIGLKKIKTYNKILVVTNKIQNEAVNAVSAARATIGIDATIHQLSTPLHMTGYIKDGKATGEYSGLYELLDEIKNFKFDALAIHTPIEVDRNVALHYYRNGGINPWGGIEAIVSQCIATELNKPVAHAPVENTSENDEELFFIFQEVVQPRIAAEALSCCYLHCVLKGLHRAPRCVQVNRADFIGDDVDALISPYKCWGIPHSLCRHYNIPIIAVKENKITNPVDCEPDIIVENYLEAAGLIQAMRAGVHPVSVRAKFPPTKII
jgi:hypothetical protein